MAEDINGKPTVLTFDLVTGKSPLIVGLDVKRHSDTVNRTGTPSIIFRRPCDTSDRTFYTYIAKDDDHNDRIKLEIVPHNKTTSASLLGNVSNRREIAMVKKIHRLTHATDDEMKQLFKDGNMSNERINDACEKIHQACDICTSTGRPRNSKKISLSHVNEAFNEEIQVDYTVAYINEQKYFILNMVDAGTRYGERAIAFSRDAKTMMEMIETHWLYNHGAPKYFSADPEFCKTFFEKFLLAHKITLRPRPSRASFKNGRVERNNGVFKTVLSRLIREKTTATPPTLIARASFLTNLFHGNSDLSAFQLARGYAPSILGIPSSVVSQDILDAHIQTTAVRAIQRAMRSNNNNVQPGSSFEKGKKVWIFYKSSKQNESVGWIEAIVVEPMLHSLKCRRTRRGPPMNVAYEHVRIAPEGELANSLTHQTLEDELYGNRSTEDHDTAYQLMDTNDSSAEQKRKATTSEDANGGTVVDDNINGESCVNNIPESDQDKAQLMEDIFGEDEQDSSQDPQPKRQSLLSKSRTGNITKDVGDTPISEPGRQNPIVSDEQKVLEQVYVATDGKQVSRKQMECAPQWLLDKSVKNELDANWKGSYIEVNENNVAPDANVISAHFVYKVKVEEKDKKRLKARLCPHGNRDKMKHEVRKDSATAQFDVIRMICSIASILMMKLGCIDIKGAYMQSGPIKRDIYIRPPRECNAPRGILWKLTKLPYGITEAGRQWAKVMEGWLIEEARFERVCGISQFFVKRNTEGKIIMILAKVTDDMLIAGSIEEIKNFITQVEKRFPISKSIINDDIKFNGCDITQDENNTIKMSMNAYVRNMKYIEIPTERKKHRLDKATDDERNAFRSMAGEFIWAGSGALPPAAYIGSWMQQRVPSLTVEDILQANGMLKEMRELKADIIYRTPVGVIKKVVVTSFSDAAFNISKSTQYGQTGLVTGIRLVGEDNIGDIYHMIDWASVKQKRVCYSSYGAEILACTEADDRGYNIKLSMASLFPQHIFTHELNVDSKGLYDTITTLHEGRDYRLRQTVQRIRDSFESQELNAIRWIQGPVNISDGLTKRNPISQRLLMGILNSGRLELPRHDTFCVDSEHWI